MLPYSRNHETEADKIGLVLMAIADTILIKQFLSGLEWQQVQTVKLHLNFKFASI
jgi:Zn-dependent protease with chaperone function